MSRQTDDDAPHPLDIALGARVRQRRKELGLSQDVLGRAVGVTFQQMQKYEHGTNSISFSRLAEPRGDRRLIISLTAYEEIRACRLHPKTSR